MIIPFSALAQSLYKLDGKIGGKYPVVIELEEFEEGLFSGQYAYTSTLRKSGDNVYSWLLINLWIIIGAITFFVIIVIVYFVATTRVTQITPRLIGRKRILLFWKQQK